MGNSPFVLAIESHAEQAALLRERVAEEIQGQLTLVDSIEAAMAAMDCRMPNLILVSALMSPRDEAKLISRLRARSGAESVDVLFIPLLAKPDEPRETRWRFKRGSRAPHPSCDPAMFADQVKTYLSRVAIADPISAVYRQSSDRQASERRSAYRVSNVNDTRVVIDGLSVSLIDLSVIGAQIVSPGVLQPGRPLQVVFENSRETIRCHAGIVWSAFEVLQSTQLLCYRAGIDFKDAGHPFLETLCSGRAESSVSEEAFWRPLSART